MTDALQTFSIICLAVTCIWQSVTIARLSQHVARQLRYLVVRELQHEVDGQRQQRSHVNGERRYPS